MEALMATAILFAGVLAVFTAITTAQQTVVDAELQLEASVRAEEKLQGLVQADYNAVDFSYEEFEVRGRTFRQLVNVIITIHDLPDVNVALNGKEIVVSIDMLIDLPTDQWRNLAEVRAFIPAPP
jgi:hypothetical protein